VASEHAALDPAAALYHQSVEGCLEAAIGPTGLSGDVLEPWLERAGAAVEALKAAHADGSLPLLRIAAASEDIAAARAALDRLSEGAQTLVFFGTGGSSLGGQTLAQLAGWNIPGGADEAQRARPRTRFYDNLDPQTLSSALATLDLAHTRFIVTSKSGGTAETLVQGLTALEAVRAAGLEREVPRLFLGLTEPAMPGRRNGLRALFEPLGIPILEHHTGIGGRFSVLTNVGLLPAMARGLDASAIRAGAQAVVEEMLAGESPFPPALGAAVSVAMARERDIRVQVMMPYADRLGRFAHWFVQLWAESLGKGGQGTTPIAALGPLDQHSQLQLFMDGPREHFITVVRTATAGHGPSLAPEPARAAGITFMAGRTVGDLVAAQAEAIAAALAEAGRPVRTFDLERLDEHTIGALLMHFMLETIIAGRLLGIDPFDQPAVELAKRLTRERLSAD
jgi:glucose-6-phosphate isomerase